MDSVEEQPGSCFQTCMGTDKGSEEVNTGRYKNENRNRKAAKILFAAFAYLAWLGSRCLSGLGYEVIKSRHCFRVSGESTNHKWLFADHMNL